MGMRKETVIKEIDNVNRMLCEPRKSDNTVLTCRIFNNIETLKGRETQAWDVAVNEAVFGLNIIKHQYWDRGNLRLLLKDTTRCTVSKKEDAVGTTSYESYELFCLE